MWQLTARGCAVVKQRNICSVYTNTIIILPQAKTFARILTVMFTIIIPMLNSNIDNELLRESLETRTVSTAVLVCIHVGWGDS